MNTTTQAQTTLASNQAVTSTLKAGIITGQIAGLIMAVVVMLVFALFLGTSPFYPVQVIGSMALGESALHGFNFAAVLVGVLLHQLGPSLLWGVIYGALATKFTISSQKDSVILGVFVGVISMVGPYLLIPTLMNALHGADYWNQNVPMFWDWASHLVFGASFILYPKIRAKLS
jgi:hypothetical protein